MINVGEGVPLKITLRLSFGYNEQHSPSDLSSQFLVPFIDGYPTRPVDFFHIPPGEAQIQPDSAAVPAVRLLCPGPDAFELVFDPSVEKDGSAVSRSNAALSLIKRLDAHRRFLARLSRLVHQAIWYSATGNEIADKAVVIDLDRLLSQIVAVDNLAQEKGTSRGHNAFVMAEFFRHLLRRKIDILQLSNLNPVPKDGQAGTEQCDGYVSSGDGEDGDNKTEEPVRPVNVLNFKTISLDPSSIGGLSDPVFHHPGLSHMATVLNPSSPHLIDFWTLFKNFVVAQDYLYGLTIVVLKKHLGIVTTHSPTPVLSPSSADAGVLYAHWRNRPIAGGESWRHYPKGPRDALIVKIASRSRETAVRIPERLLAEQHPGTAGLGFRTRTIRINRLVTVFVIFLYCFYFLFPTQR